MLPSVRLLGNPHVELGGVIHEPEASRASAALYYLAHRGAWTTRHELAYLFWPDTTQERSLLNLRQLVHVMRGLPYAVGLEVERNRLRWRVETDLPTLSALEQGPVWWLEHYRRPPTFMAGFSLKSAPEFDNWLETERSYWEARQRDDLTRSIDSAVGSGEGGAALRLIEAWLGHQPLDEDLVRRSLSIALSLGHLDDGERRFRAFEAELMREVGLQPSAAIIRAHDALVAEGLNRARTEPVSVGPVAGREPALPRHVGEPPNLKTFDTELDHQDASADFEHRWEGLTAESREALVKLSVFKGGCTISEAREVADVAGSTLVNLRDERILSIDSTGRIALTPGVEHYMSEVAKAYDLSSTARRHAEYFLSLIGQQESAGAGGSAEAYGILQAAHPNIEAAWSWAIEAGEWQPMSKARNVLRLSYQYAGRHERYWELVRAALAHMPEDHPSWPVLTAYEGDYVEDEGRWEDGVRMKRRAVEAARRIGDPFALAWSLYRYGVVNGYRAGASEHRLRKLALEEADRILEVLGEREVRALVLQNLVGAGDTWDERERWYLAGEDVRAALGSPLIDGVAATLRAVDLADRHGRHAEAVRLTELALVRSRSRPAFELANSLAACADMNLRLGDLGRAQKLAEDSHALSSGFPGVRRYAAGILARVYLARGELQKARATAVADLEALPDFRAEILAFIELEAGNVREARAWFDAQDNALRSEGPLQLLCDRVYRGYMGLLDAKIALEEGDPERARHVLLDSISELKRWECLPWCLSGMLIAAPLLDPELRVEAAWLVAAHPGAQYVDRKAAFKALPKSRAVLTGSDEMAVERYPRLLEGVMDALATTMEAT